jgi:hypothetical protein
VQPAQMKTWATVASSTSDERNQTISILHLGQIGSSSCSSDRLSLSTMAVPSCRDADQLRTVLKIRPGHVAINVTSQSNYAIDHY